MHQALCNRKHNNPRRQSNLERAKWRAKCRDVLAEHIEQRLGIKLDPGQVRLNPSNDDCYSWKLLVDDHLYLFERNLSDQTIGVYKDLCNLVGQVFEAVPREPSGSMSSGFSFMSAPAKPASLLLGSTSWKFRTNIYPNNLPS
ncbi:hypothetical protein CCHR01_08038 [Colletotrichum chrysophilum]|uniref:Uncharacterized protein n=1 Tax=Colletotrichum chrysophilum TaxID=1836956 RepID=A0AAD9ELX0_9PEZI|nr:hypothetical protein CCHR01_08038 [Colletotrichum chrysophilum]